MTTRSAIIALLHAIYRLHHKLSTMDLGQRLKRYRHKISGHKAPNIATSLNKHIDQLATQYKSTEAESPTQPVAAKAEQGQHAHDVGNHSESPPWLKSLAPGLSEAYKISATSNPSDQCMGAKLKDSTWLHLHTSIMQARRGDVVKAKLHANIANDALKEAAHYMSEAEFKALCRDVQKALPRRQDGVG